MDKRSRRQLARTFHQQHGLCHWCGQPMLPPGSFAPKHGMKTPPRLCTMDHLYDRLDDGRGKNRDKKCKVAACHECNNRRGAENQAKLSIEELWRRSGRYPRHDPAETEGQK